MQLPSQFITAIENAPGFEAKGFLETHAAEDIVTSVRINAEKQINNHTPTTSIFSDTKAVKWCEQGVYLPNRPSFTLDPLLHAGAYYVQEASSMFIWHILSAIFPEKQAPIIALDLCAAPGGKTTLLADYFTNGLIISNEVIKQRSATLIENTTKWGSGNIVVTNNDPAAFSKMPSLVDLLLIDAPCSGSGLFRRDVNAINEWSEANVQLCSARQKRIIADALPTLKEGGILLYATCSFSVEENEQMVDWMLTEYNLTSISITHSSSWGIVTTNTNKNGVGYRFYPNKLQGEGFFITAFTKNNSTNSAYLSSIKNSFATTTEITLFDPFLLPNNKVYSYIKHVDTFIAVPTFFLEIISKLLKHLYVRKIGIRLGELKRNEVIPHHELAVSNIYNKKCLPQTSLSLEQAINFLKKNTVDLLGNSTIGWSLATYKNYGLGWMKLLSNRMNNYYPVEWRILKK